MVGSLKSNIYYCLLAVKSNPLNLIVLCSFVKYKKSAESVLYELHESMLFLAFLTDVTVVISTNYAIAIHAYWLAKKYRANF